jgi:hypothetical protein
MQIPLASMIVLSSSFFARVCRQLTIALPRDKAQANTSPLLAKAYEIHAEANAALREYRTSENVAPHSFFHHSQSAFQRVVSRKRSVDELSSTYQKQKLLKS